MDYEFDEEKSRLNLEKHHVSFEYARRIFEGNVLEWVDARFEYGETRFIAVGAVEDHILTVVYTWREDRRRIISARKANRRERNAYGAQGIG